MITFNQRFVQACRKLMKSVITQIVESEKLDCSNVLLLIAQPVVTSTEIHPTLHVAHRLDLVFLHIPTPVSYTHLDVYKRQTIIIVTH